MEHPADGAVTYGECVLPGQIEDEFLISTHVCNPSLCNDNLSGVAVAATLARVLAPIPRRFTYRFLFVPGTVGASPLMLRETARASMPTSRFPPTRNRRGFANWTKFRTGGS